MSRVPCFSALLALLIAACGESELTQTVIIVQAQPGVQQRASHTTLVVTAQALGSQTPVHSDEGAPRPASFPYVIALSPRSDDADRVYQVEVKALAQGQPIAVARLVSGYVPNQTRYVTLWLEEACLDKPPCGAEQTCHIGTCVDARVDPAMLGRERDNPPASYSLPPPADAGLNADASTPADGGARDGGNADAGAQRDATTPADAGAPDVGAGPADAGAGNDSGAPPPDSGVPAMCAPTGPWHLQFTETSAMCTPSGTFSVAVNFRGKLSDYLADPVNCEYDSTLSPDGCELDYTADCTSTDDMGQELDTFESGTLIMTSADGISGALYLQLDFADDSSCTTSGEVVGAPGSP